ncbi:hypothetical protein HELRODRAFT_186281 [Helobdella robusta]|uniref:Uncharacterized protein n=1 Tax=Helobdella robusta TaxID=6412 RepID=T1FNW8_HELRO|nr:hypothetical protein HELRODRAFT_186281 [Helobdella robusta]ESO10300.1 hypothetical protein HELRODRAFT_186281 [Helobdella robusta]
MSADVQNFEWALKNGDLDQVKALVEKDKRLVNLQLSTGRYPLCMAADYGQIDIIEFLVSQNADINVKDRHGISPLLSAIYEGHINCVKYLIEKGASKIGKAPDGTPYADCTDVKEIKQLLS